MTLIDYPKKRTLIATSQIFAHPKRPFPFGYLGTTEWCICLATLLSISISFSDPRSTATSICGKIFAQLEGHCWGSSKTSGDKGMDRNKQVVWVSADPKRAELDKVPPSQFHNPNSCPAKLAHTNKNILNTPFNKKLRILSIKKIKSKLECSIWAFLIHKYSFPQLN